jgi:hypothetical protein
MSTTLAVTLAVQATNVSQIGFKLLAVTSPFLAAGSSADELKQNMGGALGILNLVGLVLAFGGLLFAAVMFMMGQTERMIYGLVGALVGGLAFLIVKAMFGSSGQEGLEDIDLNS